VSMARYTQHERPRNRLSFGSAGSSRPPRAAVRCGEPAPLSPGVPQFGHWIARRRAAHHKRGEHRGVVSAARMSSKAASALPSASERAARSIAKRVSTARAARWTGARERRTALYRRRRHRWAPDEARRRPTSLPNITPWHDGHAHHREVSVGSSPRSPGNTTRQRPHWRGDGGPENPGMVPPGSCSGGGVGPACPETTSRVTRFKRGVPTKWTMRHLDRTPVRACRPRTSEQAGVWARLFRLLGSDVFQPGTRPLGPLEHQVSTDR
jgi:hypothetical protein